MDPGVDFLSVHLVPDARCGVISSPQRLSFTCRHWSPEGHPREPASGVLDLSGTSGRYLPVPTSAALGGTLDMLTACEGIAAMAAPL